MQLKMPCQFEDCVIHGFERLNEVNGNNAFDLSHWDNDNELITYLIPTIEDQNKLNILCSHPIPHRLFGPIILLQQLAMSTI